MINKKLFSIILSLQLIFAIQLNNFKNIEKNSILFEENILPYKTYNLLTSTIPFWKNNIMYNESIMFIGKDSVASLLYKLTEIISITSYDGTITYIEGTDYLVKNGKIYLTSGTRIPFFTIE